jgi:hypothetical protein
MDFEKGIPPDAPVGQRGEGFGRHFDWIVPQEMGQKKAKLYCLRQNI